MLVETIAQEALRLLSAVPAEEWITETFTNTQHACCALGHFQRLNSDDPNDYSFPNCNGTYGHNGKTQGTQLRESSEKFIHDKYGSYKDIANVNNDPKTNGYSEPVIKDRVIHLLNDMVAAGY